MKPAVYDINDKPLSELVEMIANGQAITLLRDGQPVAKLSAIRRFRTAGEFAKKWRTMRHLSPEDAEAFAKDIEEGRRSIPPLKSAWDS